MNERLQKNCLDFFSFYDVSGEAAAKSDLKVLCVVRDLSWEKKAYF